MGHRRPERRRRYVCQFGRDFKGKVILFGLNPTADVRAENIEALGTEGTRFDLIYQELRQSVRSPLLGTHNIYNVLAAAAVALEHGITPSEIAATLPALEPADKRGQVVQLGNITVLNDCYNSSPKALMAAVDTLAAMPLGDELLSLARCWNSAQPANNCIASAEATSRARSWIFCSACGNGEADGRSRSRGGHESGICRHARRSRRVAGPRNAGRRCSVVESFARRKVGKGAGSLATKNWLALEVTY